MFKNITTGIVGLACTLALGACGGAPGGEGTSPEDVNATSDALTTYGHYWDVVEGGSNNGNAYRNQLYNQQATDALLSWGMPVVLEDWCTNNSDPNCQPTNAHPHPAWVHVKYTTTGSWSNWVYIPDASYQENGVGTQWGDPNGLIIGCHKYLSGSFNNNWWCGTGTGGPGFSAYIEAKYGQ